VSHYKRDDPRSHDLLHQGYNVLEADFARGKGTSKHADKLSGAGYAGKLYTDSTLASYKRSWADFCADLKAQGARCKTLQEAAAYVPGYIERLEQRPGKTPGSTSSAWTVRARFAGVGKVLGLSARDYDLPTRHRADITRSRDDTPRAGDRHFSTKNNADLINFCCCCGLRNDKELAVLRGSDLIERVDGSYAVHVRQGKGGKEREVTLYGSEAEISRAVSRMRDAGEELVWPKIHSNADIHGYRATYAQRVYAAHARPIEEIPKKDRYYCRGDKKRTIYDKKAMEIASRELGHNRINVIAEHYL